MISGSIAKRIKYMYVDAVQRWTDRQTSNQPRKQPSKQARFVFRGRILHNNLVEQCQPATNQHVILQNIPG